MVTCKKKHRYCNTGVGIIWSFISSAIRFNTTPNPMIPHVMYQAQLGKPPSFFFFVSLTPFLPSSIAPVLID